MVVSRIRQALARFGDRGVTAVEYGLIIAGVGLLAVGGLFFLRNSLGSAYTNTLDNDGIYVCDGGANCVDAAYGGLPDPDVPVTTFTLSKYTPTTGVRGQVFQSDPTVLLGTPPYVFSVTSGSLPPGLALDSVSGRISGTPTATGSYPVTISVDDSTTTPATSKQVTFVISFPVPTITAVAPATGPTAGGTNITITGTNFESGATVRVDGAAATNVTVASATQITATTPSGSSGPANVVVQNPDGNFSNNGSFTYLGTPPTIASVTPASGPYTGGTAISITGTDFVSGATVTVGGNPATSVTVVSSTQITATTPGGTAGSASVIVTNPDTQTSNSGSFTYRPGPTVTGVSPSTGTKSGGTSITIAGTDFATDATVSLGGTACTVTARTSTSITCTTQAAASGLVNVVVTNPTDSLNGTLTNGFRYLDPTCGSSQILVNGTCTPTPSITLCYNAKKNKSETISVFSGYTYAANPYSASINTVTGATSNTTTSITYAMPNTNSGTTTITFTFTVTYPINGGTATGSGSGSLTFTWSNGGPDPATVATC